MMRIRFCAACSSIIWGISPLAWLRKPYEKGPNKALGRTMTATLRACNIKWLLGEYYHPKGGRIA